mmetsp:Transcript_20964/g.47284  ORF Transcript_20964/g.47284 Transcript_20964/m.47284 type:complete len:319 (+) Transcript_20964:74-1030(+)
MSCTWSRPGSRHDLYLVASSVASSRGAASSSSEPNTGIPYGLLRASASAASHCHVGTPERRCLINPDRSTQMTKPLVRSRPWPSAVSRSFSSHSTHCRGFTGAARHGSSSTLASSGAVADRPADARTAARASGDRGAMFGRVTGITMAPALMRAAWPIRATSPAASVASGPPTMMAMRRCFRNVLRGSVACFPLSDVMSTSRSASRPERAIRCRSVARPSLSRFKMRARPASAKRSSPKFLPVSSKSYPLTPERVATRRVAEMKAASAADAMLAGTRNSRTFRNGASISSRRICFLVYPCSSCIRNPPARFCQLTLSA